MHMESILGWVIEENNVMNAMSIHNMKLSVT